MTMIRLILICISLTAAFGFLSSCGTSSSRLTIGEKFFVTEVKPILEGNCVACHNSDQHPSRLDLTSLACLLAARGDKHFIIPGNPDDSLLVSAVSRKGGHPKVMPRLDLSLTEDQIAVLREWIQDGAAWPKGSDGKLVAKANPER
jgi:mono/diheme cytochrome c family protein